MIYYTPPHVYDAVCGSGAYLARVTDSIIGNPPYSAPRTYTLLGYVMLGCMFAFVFALFVATSERRR